MRSVLLLIFLGIPLAGGAQVPTVAPGARLRMETSQTDKRLEGTLISQTADSLTIASVGAIRTAVPSGSITRIRVSQGESHGAGAMRGIKIGGRIGLGLGVLLGLGASLVSDENPVVVFAAVTALYTVYGVALGAAIGGAVGAEKWTTIYPPPIRSASVPATMWTRYVIRTDDPPTTSAW